MGEPLVDAATVEAAYPAFSSVAGEEQTRRILAASAAIEAYVGRPLGLTTVAAEPHRPENTRRIYLRVCPVVSISSVVYGRPGAQMSLTADADYSILSPENGAVELYRAFSSGFRYPDRMYGGDPRSGSVYVTYTGGYATADVPPDVQQATILTVMSSGSTLGLNGGGLFSSEQIGEYSYRLSASGGGGPTTAGMGLPPSAIGLIHGYRRLRFA